MMYYAKILAINFFTRQLPEEIDKHLQCNNFSALSELKNLFQQNNQDVLRWKNEPSGLPLKQLAPEKIHHFLTLVNPPKDAALYSTHHPDQLHHH